jgi:hypothetical protein
LAIKKGYVSNLQAQVSLRSFFLHLQQFKDHVRERAISIVRGVEQLEEICDIRLQLFGGAGKNGQERCG